MRFHQPKDSDFKRVLSILDPDAFLKDMVKRGMLDKITGKYNDDVYDLCNNAVSWALLALKDTPYLYQVEIVKGTFQGRDHAWLKVGCYYLDLTLAQFIDCPRVAVMRIEEVNKPGLYQEDETFPFDLWIRELQTNSTLIDYKQDTEDAFKGLP